MSNSAFNFFHTPERNISKSSLNTIGANSIGMLHPTKTSNVNFPSKSFTPVASKPRGLSIRSQSDLNISQSVKPASSLKSDEAKKSTSTLNKEKVLKTVRLKQKQGLSPNSKSPHTAVSPIFKRPLTPKVTKKVYPEPEKLAGYFNYEENFDRVLYRARALDNEAKELSAAICKPVNVIKPFEDECVPSFTPLIEHDLPALATANEDLVLSGVEIPSLSDEDH